MEKRKSHRRRTGELKTTARGVASDAESSVSTRSSNSSKSNSSSTSWKQKRRLKAERLSSRDNADASSKERKQEEDDGQGDGNDKLESLESRLGSILETTEAQMAMIFLIALDVGCTALEMHLHDQQQLAAALQKLHRNDKDAGAGSEIAASLLVRVATRLVESFTGFTLFLFLIELAVLLAAFRRRFFAHAGYVLDLAVVSISLAVELSAQTKAVRLLGILRVWRVLRLVRRLVDQERNAHDATFQLLEQEQLVRLSSILLVTLFALTMVTPQKLLHVRMQKDAAHESLKREYESRSGLEQLLRSYKDEIVTLKEALQIAAQAVAEFTMSETPPADPNLYALQKEAVAAEASFSSYPAVESDGFGDAYYEHEMAAVHSSDLQAELETQYWQDGAGEDSEYPHEQAAAVHPTELQVLEEEHWQGGGEGEYHHPDAPPEQLAGVHSELEEEHGSDKEEENEFEDAVDE
ncbi:unnamed protein product [Phytophthora lilii]|uniref:Voltage-gated hydrogen channel 1 n=1 Tax=Phytophthora lilii TaxID=2077276 RepID=A0A9W6YI87_9STRA|nr:unnamed protein product [Phytophthora lilii]